MNDVTKMNGEATALTAAEEAFDRPMYVPETDIYEDNDCIYVVSNIPGVPEKDVEVSLDNKVLSFSGVQQERIKEGYERVGSGGNVGLFKRSFRIEADVDTNAISAEIKDGVLRISLPKSEEIKPRTIKVKAG